VCGESSTWRFPSANEFWDMAEKGRLTVAQRQLTLPKQPAELLFNVKNDPYQLNNLAANHQYREVLQQIRRLLEQWKEQTGDTVPAKPTPDRQPLHDSIEKMLPRGEYPGAARNATMINHPGPVSFNP